jgi:hypothetical protein
MTEPDEPIDKHSGDCAAAESDDACKGRRITAIDALSGSLTWVHGQPDYLRDLPRGRWLHHRWRPRRISPHPSTNSNRGLFASMGWSSPRSDAARRRCTLAGGPRLAPRGRPSRCRSPSRLSAAKVPMAYSLMQRSPSRTTPLPNNFGQTSATPPPRPTVSNTFSLRPGTQQLSSRSSPRLLGVRSDPVAARRASRLFVRRRLRHQHGADFDLMGQATADQRWGLGTLPGARYKGGWGPSPDGRYLVRQIDIIDTPSGAPPSP